MPNKDKKSPVTKCPGCGKPTTSGQRTCQYCGYILIPAPRPVPQIPPGLLPPHPIVSYQSETDHTATRQQAKKPKEDDEAKLCRLNMGAAKAQIVTAIVMTITMVAAITAAFYAYSDFKIAYNEYTAKTRPELIIQNLAFNNISDNTTDLAINITNFGDRPARNICIESLLLCAVSTANCKIILGTYDVSQADIILYPGRVTTLRMTINRKDYEGIMITDILEVGIKYRYSNQEYGYEADLRLHQEDNVWHIEQELSIP